MQKIFFKAMLLLLCCSLTSVASAQGLASKLFKQLKQQVYQIRVVDLASGDKNSIGSGFQISKEGHLATNFHVVSSYVHEPEKYRLEYVFHDGSTGDVQLLDIDVIHDLAIIKIQPPQQKYFRFNLQPLAKGDRIYSMGNPHDLSMLIIEGNYNGLIQESRYKKILFSGSLNPGMSGGPAFDQQGRLVGVNVAKGGEQLSFLVPIEKLHRLYARVQQRGAAKDFQKIIEADLTKDQQTFYSRLLEKPWESEDLGDVSISGKLDKSLKCWGFTVDKKDIYYKGVNKLCRSEDRIYISRNMKVGMFSYDYKWLSTEQLNRFQFYNQLQRTLTSPDASSIYRKEDVTNYICSADFIELSGHSWKISTCMRAFKKYKGLYDVVFMLASVEKNDRSLLAQVAMSGVSKDNSKKFMQKFLEAIKWKN